MEISLEDIKKLQEDFLKDPRKNIIKLKEDSQNWIKEFNKKLSSENNLPLLILFSQFHKEYGELILKLNKDKVISGRDFKDDIFDLKNAQRINEVNSVIEAYVSKKAQGKIDSVTALSISRLYSSQLEVLWGKFKRVIYIKYPKIKDYLNLKKLEEQLTDLEKEYSISLSSIKSTLQGLLRNNVSHETTYFNPPDEIVFSEMRGKNSTEIKRLNLEEICSLLLKIMVINSAIDHIEKTLIISSLDPLLLLSDSELDEYCKTGILTEGMNKKIEEKANSLTE